MHVAAEPEAEALVIDEAGEVAAIDALAVAAGARLLPRPARRRVPVGDVVVLVAVAEIPQGHGDRALPSPLGRPPFLPQRWRVTCRGRAPTVPAFERPSRVPLRVRHFALKP